MNSFNGEQCNVRVGMQIDIHLIGRVFVHIYDEIR